MQEELKGAELSVSGYAKTGLSLILFCLAMLFWFALISVIETSNICCTVQIKQPILNILFWILKFWTLLS